MSPNQANTKSDSTGPKRTKSFWDKLKEAMFTNSWGRRIVSVKGFYWPSLWLFMIWSQLASIGIDIDRYVTHFVGPIVTK